MTRFDRLTTLMDRFSLRVLPAPPEEATLAVTAGPDGAPVRALFRARTPGFERSRVLLFSAAVDWGGAANPLLAALPEEIAMEVGASPETAGLIALLQAEVTGQRCGHGAVLNRLGEVLIVRLLRARIEQGSTRPGLLAGLADPRLSRAIVAIHDHPGRDWRNEDLARIAGLSLSRFAELFPATVGEPPAVYLRRWRLTLARQDIHKGDRVEAVARRYGYGSPDSFARAYKRQFGAAPVTQRPRGGG